MKWIGLQGEPIDTITDFPDNTFGFVYRIVHKPTGKSYIGKKVLYFNNMSIHSLLALPSSSVYHDGHLLKV